MKEFEIRLKFPNGDIEKVNYSANDEQLAFKQLFKNVENGWLFIAGMGHPRFINVNAALEMEIVDIKTDRIETEKRTQEAREAMKNFR